MFPQLLLKNMQLHQKRDILPIMPSCCPIFHFFKEKNRKIDQLQNEKNYVCMYVVPVTAG